MYKMKRSIWQYRKYMTNRNVPYPNSANFHGKAYQSAILDLADKSIVSFVIGSSNNNALVFETFDIARQEHPEVKPLFHSGRGYQYTSKSFRKKLEEAGMTQSMSRVSRCIDNGPMEAFWGMLKSEMYYLKKISCLR